MRTLYFISLLFCIVLLASCYKQEAPSESVELDVELDVARFSKDGSIVVYQKERDALFIQALIERAFPHAKKEIPLDDHEVTSSDESGNTERYEQLIFVKLVENKPVGFMRLLCSDRSLYIAQLAVDEAHRNKGYGTELIKAACALAHEIDGIVSAPLVNDATCRLFEGCKFSKIPDRPEFCEYRALDF